MAQRADIAMGGDDYGESGGQRRAVRALRRSEERFRLLVDSVVEYAIFILDPHGNIDTWNAGAQRLKGYEQHEIVGEHHSLFYPPEYREERLPQRLLAEALEQGQATHTGWRVRKDGTRFWADVVITALFEEDGRHTGFAKVTRDRTEAHQVELERERMLDDQRELVAQLEQLDDWRREFIGSVVHDLQTPVAAINGFTHLLRDGFVEDEQVPTVLESVLSNTSSLQELIDNLRAYTVVSEPEPPLVLERIELQAFISQLVSDTAPLLGQRTVEVDVSDVEAEVDRQGLERILRNLLSNVARHTSEESTVWVRGRRNDDAIVLEVEDDGRGIPAELLPHVFDRFEHGGKGGTGLGLPIVRRYVELHGGTITVDSAEGRGTTFRFTLPAA